MSEEQTEQIEQPVAWGDYHPEAAEHPPYNEAMAAWRNEVRALQIAGVLPGGPEPEAPLVETVELPQDPEKPPQIEEPQKPVQGETESPEQTEGASEGEQTVLTESDADKNSPFRDFAEQFDPDEHNAPVVIAYLEHLDGVDEDEQWRVLSMEKDGRGRKGILNPRYQILLDKRAEEGGDTPKE